MDRKDLPSTNTKTKKSLEQTPQQRPKLKLNLVSQELSYQHFFFRLRVEDDRQDRDERHREDGDQRE